MLLQEELWFGNITQRAAKKVTTVTTITCASPTITSPRTFAITKGLLQALPPHSNSHFIVIIPFYRFVVYCPRSQTYSLMDLEFQGLWLHSYFGLNSYFINSYFLSVPGTGPFQPTLLPLLLSAECFCSFYIQYHLQSDHLQSLPTILFQPFQPISFPGGSVVKNLPAHNAGDMDSIPGWERSPGEENGNPLQYSCPENPVDGGAWRAAVDAVEKTWT